MRSSRRRSGLYNGLFQDVAPGPAAGSGLPRTLVTGADPSVLINLIDNAIEAMDRRAT